MKCQKIKEWINFFQASPRSTPMTFRTEREVPKVGLMQVGWGGNNGSTVTATVLANKHKLSWKTKGEINQSFPILNVDLIALRSNKYRWCEERQLLRVHHAVFHCAHRKRLGKWRGGLRTDEEHSSNGMTNMTSKFNLIPKIYRHMS